MTDRLTPEKVRAAIDAAFCGTLTVPQIAILRRLLDSGFVEKAMAMIEESLPWYEHPELGEKFVSVEGLIEAYRRLQSGEKAK